MAYRSTYRRRTRIGFRVAGTGLVLAALVAAFIASVYLFRKSNNDLPTQNDDTIANVLTAAPVAIPAVTNSKEAVLHDLTGQGASGVATRGEKDGHYYHTIKAILPGIDRASQMYEGWLVRPVPYDYFSTGEMVTNDLGEFVLEFNGDPRGEYSGYTQVVITLEAKDGISDPAAHVMEGEFE